MKESIVTQKILAQVGKNRFSERCHMCRHRGLRSVLDLGSQPHSDDFLTSDRLQEVELKYPLHLVQCDACGLLQIHYFVHPTILYGINYTYQTAASAAGVRHYHEAAAHIVKKLSSHDGALVIDIGSNTGSFLQGFKNTGCKVLGVDPARDVAVRAIRSGIPTVVDFFGRTVAVNIAQKYGKADIITGTNVFAHLHELDDAVRGMKTLLARTGTIVIEAPSALELIKHLEYDTIYHQHIGYLSVKPMQTFFSRFGLELFAVEEIPIHGGSLRYFVGFKGMHSVEKVVAQHIAEEKKFGLYDARRLEEFKRGVEEQKHALISLLIKLKSKGKKVVGLSAPAKGNTLLNYCHIDTSFLDYTTERNDLKIGLYTPGMHIPIRTDEDLLRDQPDYALLLAWNFADAIIKNNAEYRKRGGKFIIPIPKPVII